MFARKRLDLGWSDFAAGLVGCLRGGALEHRRERAEGAWSDRADVMVCLSVRSGLDLYLTAAGFERGTEILVSALTIPGMLQVIEDHGLVAVPVDVEVDTLFPTTASFAAQVTPRTRAILAAHLFGSRANLDDLAELARRRGLELLEDCAQAFTADGYLGHEGADASFFSFGTIKTATALGGAAVRVQDGSRRQTMREVESRWPVQTRTHFGKRVAKYAALHFLSGPRTYAWLAAWCARRGRDLDDFIHGAVRGFSEERFFADIRRRPSVPLLAMLERRFCNFEWSAIARRRETGATLGARLGSWVAIPASSDPDHSYWVFGVLVPDPDRLVANAREAGFDATRVASLVTVEPPPGSGARDPLVARGILEHLVYLPAWSTRSPEALEELVAVVKDAVRVDGEWLEPTRQRSKDSGPADSGQPGEPHDTAALAVELLPLVVADVGVVPGDVLGLGLGQGILLKAAVAPIAGASDPPPCYHSAGGTKVITVALDAMGGDLGVEATVGGAARLSREDVNIHVLLVGDVSAVSPALEGASYDPTRLTLVDASGCVGMDESPRAALAAKPDCSILTAARLVRDGDAQALVSAGHTGATILASVQTYSMLPGISRSALAAVYPTEQRHGPRGDPFALMLDVGATVQARADDLVGFAVMGAAYSSIVSEIPSPRIALLSNGSEANKGTPAIVEAHERLRRSPLNFVGNVEGLDIPRGTVDVVICDGFMGNIVLKMLEGVSEVVRDVARYASHRSLQWRIGLSMLGGGIRQLRRMTDWKVYGGAPLLGFDQVVIKAHGRSNERAVRNAVKVAAKAVGGGLVGQIRDGVASLQLEDEG